MRKVVLAVSSLAISVCGLAGAPQQPLNVKTGLWQVEYIMNYTGLPPQTQAMLDRLTPEQRAASGYGGKHAFKRCVTEKQLNTPWTQGDVNCNWTILKSTSSELDVHGTSCRMGRSEGLNSEVEFKIHAIDSEHVQATIHGAGTVNGVNATLDGTYAGKWASATCPH